MQSLRSSLESIREAIQQIYAAPHNERIAQQQSDAQERDKISRAIDEFRNQHKHSEDDAEAGHNRRHRHNLLAQWFTFGATFLAFVAATIVGALQWHVSKQIKDIYDWQKQSDISVHRPVVALTGILIDTFRDRLCQHGDCWAKETYQNLGNSPTSCLRIQSAVKESYSPPVPPWDIDTPASLTTDLSRFLSQQEIAALPNGPRVDAPIPLRESMFNRLATPKDKGSFYIFGKVSYKDLFPDHPAWHLVEFCSRYPNVHIDKTKDPNADGLAFYWDQPVTCQEKTRIWNCTDEECGSEYADLLQNGNAGPGDPSGACSK